MDQKTLRRVEKQCIQEEAPACQSACPLHVDVRTFVLKVGQGKWNDAWKILDKTLPFPGILGRICHHPCQDACLRKKLGGSIGMGKLEKICVNQPKPRIRTIPMPKKNYSIAVVGENLSSLVVALELLRKGYGVTLFTSRDRLGGSLWDMEGLSGEIIQKEFAVLENLGLKQKKRQGVLDVSTLLENDFSAVYIGLDTRESESLALNDTPDLKTFSLAQKGVFAGGTPDDQGNLLPLNQAFQGRGAALSIERFVQGVSLKEGRGDEGPYPTRLFTNTEGIDPLPRVLPLNEAKGYSIDEAKAEALRCIQCQCLECLKVCPYLAHYKGYPKKYAREIYNNATIVMGNHSANSMLNSCSLCGLCQEICPENFSMTNLCLDARRDLVQRKKMPPSAHEFALQDMAFSNSEQFMLLRHAPDRKKSRFAFFPGCQLAGSNPKHVIQTYSFLINNWEQDTGLMLQCCAAPAHWSGNEAKTHEAIGLLEESWQKMGEPHIILACSSCMDMFKKYLPQVTVSSLWEIMDQCKIPSGACKKTGQAMVIHDPCTTRYESGIQAAVRSLASKLGIPITELELSREKTQCCGFGGLMENANPVMSKKQLEQRVNESELDFLTYCAMCRESLRGAGKPTAHLLDFIFPRVTEGENPGAREKVGLSRSRDNRTHLKKNILERVWKETSKTRSETCLFISPEVQEKLDQRRILHQDIRATIAHAQATTGKQMQSTVSGHFLTCHRPFMVTFWVEYSPAETGYTIHNSYCHRMQIMGEHS
ncbi:MAG: 4Fe-4S dicluster domain-containing protein [Desulfobacterium sp.]